MTDIEQIEQMIEIETSSYQPLRIDNFDIDISELLTDDLVAIFIHFKDNKRAINQLVQYVEQLPYSIKMDMMYYFSKEKKTYKQLLKIKSFNKMVDLFSKAIIETKVD